MRDQEKAREQAEYHAAQLIDALQDADAPDEVIEMAERVYEEFPNN